MKIENSKLIRRVCFFILLILSIPVLISAQDFKPVQDGIEYAEMTREIDKLPVKMNLLRLDLTKVRLDVVHAMDAAIGLEKTSSIAMRHGAFAAINAGFFRLDNSIFAGDAAGLLVIDQKLLSESFNNRIALSIENANRATIVNFNHLTIAYKVKVGKQEFEISGFNRERKNDEIVLFTPEFSQTTLTNPKGIEIIIRRNKITKILDMQGSTKIPSDGLVLSASGRLRDQILKAAKEKSKIEIIEYLIAADSNAALNTKLSEDIVAGVPQLIKDGKIKITWEEEKSSKAFVETRHPRTAVAKLKDGKFLMVTVDGRSESSGGIGLEDLAKILLELGATDAMNLDGGGSSTMFLDGRVVNNPSDKEGERRVSDAILVFPRKKN